MKKKIYNEETLKELLDEKEKGDQQWDKKIKDFEKEVRDF